VTEAGFRTFGLVTQERPLGEAMELNVEIENANQDLVCDMGHRGYQIHRMEQTETCQREEIQWIGGCEKRD
jgi:hypothetical protein